MRERKKRIESGRLRGSDGIRITKKVREGIDGREQVEAGAKITRVCEKVKEGERLR